MKFLYLISIVCPFIYSNCFSQVYFKTSYAIGLDTISTPTYEIPETDPEFKIIKIENGYGEFTIKNVWDLDKLKDASVISVDLVFTRYPADDNFDELNKKRVAFLHLMCPDVFASTVTHWRMIAQTNCTSKSSASSMFHGFVITYREAPVFSGGGSDKEAIKDILDGKKSISDSTIFKVLGRKKFNDGAVVADFTGSMSPYIAQVLLWYYLTFATNQFSDFVFFNDGDAKRSEEKILGKVGGVYYCKSGNKDTVLNTAFRCISGGYGGDAQENDIEATIYALQKNKNIKSIILIADNWAPVRDMSLASKVTVPVHVILCGYRNGYLNTQYLELAYATGGSLHTIEEDIEDLKDLQEGKTVKLGGVEYKLMKGKFIKVMTR